MKQVSAIVLAAGSGRRLKSRIPKPLVEINSKPIIIYSLEILSRHPLVSEIIVTANSKNFNAIAAKIKQYRLSKNIRIVLGGKRRQDSVYRGLKAAGSGPNFVLIHDAGRPFFNNGLVSALIRQARISGAAIAGVPVKATIKEVHSGIWVKKTLKRNNLWEIQTPQVFKKDLILRAYAKFRDINATDDSMLVEKLGAKVSLVQDTYNNIKITTPEDLAIAQAIAKKWNTK